MRLALTAGIAFVSCSAFWLAAQGPSSGGVDQARLNSPRLRKSAAQGAPGSSQGLALLPGSPLLGITADEFERFRVGLDDFGEVETASEGLGPAFNGLGCAGCHSVPAIGGISPVSEVRAGYLDEEGNFTELGGGTLYHLFSLPNQECQPVIPAEANVIARRVPIPVFGAGLVEAIPDQTILALADPNDADGDGIMGRAAMVIDVASGQRRVGRFGWKSQHATLLAFSGDAYRNEMGITNDLFRTEVANNVDPLRLKECDVKADPEDSVDPLTGMRGIDAFEAFMKFLAPIGRAAETGETARGEAVFTAIGCAKCHVPVLITGQSRNPVFDRKAVPLYSDLLLHDVGTGDGIAQDDAAPNEIRTPALWGLRFRRPLLHDGSAATAGAAILRHGREAEGVLENYTALAASDKASLLAFLSAL